MSIFKSLTPNRKKFLEGLGIHSDEEMPSEFFEVIEQCRISLSPAEIFYAGNYSVSGNYYLPFCVKDIVGTDHDRYAGKTWIEAFCDLDRGEQLLEQYFINPDYYDIALKSSEEYAEHTSNIGIIKKNGKCYLYGAAGGGNNRMIIMKIRYLVMAKNKKGEELRKIDDLHTFYGNTRIIPENVEIPIIVEQLLWRHYKERYFPENISKDPSVRIFNIMYGTLFNKELVCGPLTEEEFLEYSKKLIDSFTPNKNEESIKK